MPWKTKGIAKAGNVSWRVYWEQRKPLLERRPPRVVENLTLLYTTKSEMEEDRLQRLSAGGTRLNDGYGEDGLDGIDLLASIEDLTRDFEFEDLELSMRESDDTKLDTH
jgi:hypothetical protein